MNADRIEKLLSELRTELGLAHEFKNGESLQLLPGTPYSSFALPIEYQPSRDLRPRWGNSRGEIPQLEEMFAANNDRYRDILQYMQAQLPNLIDVPRVFNEANLPQPAWLEVPFNPFDGVALYAMLTKYRPATFLEIGSGISTCFAHKAITDARLNTRIISIDPSPRAKIDAICDLTVRDGLETIADLSIFSDLKAGDVLFFDGSHRTFMNSDVTVFFIDILPVIKPGVIVHIHDITLPWDYPDMFINWYWSEQYMLATYLMASGPNVDILFPTAWVCRKLIDHGFFSQSTIDLGPDNAGHWRGGGSMWFTKRAPA